MAPRSPAVRARALQDALSLLKEQDPAAHERMRSMVPETAWQTVGSSTRTAWLGVELEREFVSRWPELLGEDGATRFLVESVCRTLVSPLFGSTIKAAFRMFGATPRAFIKVLPRAWPHIYRDHLEVRVPVADREGATIEFEDIAPALLRGPGYPLVWKAILLAIVRTSGYEAEASWTLDPARRAGTWRLRWRAE